MKMKRISSILVLLVVVFLVSGCNVFSKKVHEHCTRTGTIDENSSVTLSYDIYYTKDRLNQLEALEQVTSNDQEVLDKYEDAYKRIHENYKGIDGYDTSLERDENSVSSYMEIDYDEVDTSKIIEIEGEKDNIFVNGVAKVDKWKKLATQFGTSCSTVE